jgi:uncharacterized protein YdaL
LATITLNRKVLIKVIVSQEFKESFNKQLEVLISEINTNIEKLKSEESKLLLNVGSSFSTQELTNIRSRLSKERESQEATKKEIENKINEVKSLEIGTLYPYASIDGTVDIKEGDNLWEKLNGSEITVRDGIVISIKS